MKDPTHIYPHDCDRCIYLGPYKHHNANWGAEVFDLYFCPPGDKSYARTSLIARFGRDGDYQSQPLDIHENPDKYYSRPGDNGPLPEVYRRWKLYTETIFVC